MSDRLITAEEARERLSELESMSDWTGEDRIAAEYARTVIAQAEQVETLSRLLTGAEKSTIERAEQIKRLQTGVKLLASIEALNHIGVSQHDVINKMHPHLTAEDMEDTDE